MKKIIYLIVLLLIISNCKSKNLLVEEENNIDYSAKYAETITAKELKEHLYIYASDEFEGRNTGEFGQKKAVQYLKDYYLQLGIKSPLGGDDYFQEITAEWLNSNTNRAILKDSENVLAYIEGAEKPEEIIVISAHLDHLGTDNDKIYNGADDDGSGTVAILEIAEAFKLAANEGKRPKRSILFLHVTGEEKGLLGSKYYTINPVFPLEKTVCNLNIDMVGRIDELHNTDPNYVYLIGSDRLSKDLHQLSETINNKYTKINLDYTYNDENDPNRFYYRSDHYNFAKHNIPIIFYFNGTHEDYHQPTDTPEKIEYDLLSKRTKLIFHTAWEIANRDTRLVVDPVSTDE